MEILNFLNRILPLLFWVLLILSFNSPLSAVMTLIIAAIHELGHILMTVYHLKKKTKLPCAVLSGLRIKIPVDISYKEELFIALGGPLINLLFFIFFSFFKHETMRIFSLLSLLTAASNLIPIEGNDGYRIIKSILNITIRKPLLAENILYWISFAFSTTLTFITLFFILIFGEGYWSFLLFFSSLIISIVNREKNNNLWEYERFLKIFGVFGRFFWFFPVKTTNNLV